MAEAEGPCPHRSSVTALTFPVENATWTYISAKLATKACSERGQGVPSIRAFPEAVGSPEGGRPGRRTDRCAATRRGTTGGSGSGACRPAARGGSGSRPRATGRSSRRCSTAAAPASPGATCRSGPAPGRRSAPASPAGPGPAGGRGSSGTSPAGPTTSTRWSTAPSSAPAGTAPGRRREGIGRRGGRARPGRPEHRAPRRRRRARRPDRPRAPARAGARPRGRRRLAAGPGRGGADRRQGLRRRGAGARAARAGRAAVIPPRAGRESPRPHDREPREARHPIENSFAGLKRHRAIATRHDGRAVPFPSAIHLAATVIWLDRGHALGACCSNRRHRDGSAASHAFGILSYGSCTPIGGWPKARLQAEALASARDARPPPTERAW